MRFHYCPAQQVEDFGTLVPESDRRLFRRLDPEVHVVGNIARPVHLDDDVAGRLVVLRLHLLRADVGQQHDDHGDEADQRQQDNIAENRAGRVVVEEIKLFHDRVPIQGWR